MKLSVTQITTAPANRPDRDRDDAEERHGAQSRGAAEGNRRCGFRQCIGDGAQLGFVAPALAPQILAATVLAGGQDTVEVSYDAPKARGSYDFVCTFPGHYLAGMKGVLVVK